MHSPLDKLSTPDTPEGKRDTRWIEHLHVVTYLLKDIGGKAAWHWGCMALALPMLLLTLKVTWDARKSPLKDTVHNLTACSWACANVTWIVRERFFHDYTHVHARVFFYLGSVVVLAYYALTGLRRLYHAHRLRHPLPSAPRPR